VILVFLLALANGYKPFYGNGKISFQKTGMIIANSKPQGADVYINAKYTGSKTSYPFLSVRITSLKPGAHQLKIQKTGYKTWEKLVEVRANFVTWANYVLLFPEKLDPQPITDIKSMSVLDNSKNNRYYVMSSINTKNQTELYLYDVSTNTKKLVWPISKTPIEPWLVNPQITKTEISPDNNKLLVWAKKDNSTGVAVLDLSNQDNGFIYQIDQNKNIYQKILWNPKNSSELIALSGKSLSRISLGQNQQTTSQILDSGAIDYSIESDNNIYYVKESQTSYSLLKMSTDGNNKNVISDAVEKSTAYKFSYSKQKDVVALLPVDTKNLTAYYHLSGQPNSLKLDQDVEDMNWSKDGLRILYVSDRDAKFFDWEKTEEMAINIGTQIKNISWYFDKYHVIFQTNDGDVVVSDYDGSNQVKLANKAAVFYVYNQSSIFYNVSVDGQSNYSTLGFNF
jgi:hypothetical protein